MSRWLELPTWLLNPIYLLLLELPSHCASLQQTTMVTKTQGESEPPINPFGDSLITAADRWYTLLKI